MKWIYTFITFVILLNFAPSICLAEEDVCSDTNKITINQRGSLAKIQFANVLSRYEQYATRNGDTYCLAFDFPEGALVVSSIYSFQVKGNHNVIIDGIRLERDSENAYSGELLSVKNDKVKTDDKPYMLTMKNLELSNIKSGLIVLQGAGEIELSNSIISCVDKTGTGIFVSADGTKLEGSTISNCGTGIKIAASDAQIGPEFAADYDTLLNTLTGNATGIHQLAGFTGNKWPFNSICGGEAV